MRFQRRPKVVGDFKAARVAADTLHCEVCGWAPPAALQTAGIKAQGVHAHHIIPISCGGSDHADNLILLCPNHHYVAHRIGRQRRRTWRGPRSRDALLAEIQLLESGVDAYAAKVERAEAEQAEIMRGIMAWADGGPVPIPVDSGREKDIPESGEAATSLAGSVS